jgi:hypothetical protein
MSITCDVDKGSKGQEVTKYSSPRVSGEQSSQEPLSNRPKYQGFSDGFLADFVTDLLPRLLGKLEAGKMVQKFANYGTRAWNKRCKHRLGKLKRENQRMLRSTFEEVAEFDDTDEICSVEDIWSFATDRVDTNNLDEREHESDGREVFARRSAILLFLEPRLRDYIALKLMGFTDTNIAEQTRVTRHSVGRTKRATAKAIKHLGFKSEVEHS